MPDIVISGLYPDLGERIDTPPSALRAKAALSVAAEPFLCTPDRPPEQDPVALLAIIGVFELSNELRQPYRWDGQTLHGHFDIPHRLVRMGFEN